MYKRQVLAPMKTVNKMLVSMELHLDASIDKLDNLAMNVQLDKAKHMENAKTKEQTEPEREMCIRDSLGTELSPITMLVLMESIQNRIVENGKRGKATWLYICLLYTSLLRICKEKYYKRVLAKKNPQFSGFF